MSLPDPQTITLTGHVTPADKVASDYRYLPFDVPAGTRRIDVKYDHPRTSFGESRTGEENILDIGIFGPGSDPSEPGEFRGWTGSARTEFFVSGDAATPGYVAGPISSGMWNIMLGLYRISSEGCDFTVRITLSWHHEPSPRIRPAGTPAAKPDNESRDSDSSELVWYVGDLQSHTYYSDGKASVAEIARVARLRGLDFLAVTDHNSIGHLPELDAHSDDDFLLLPGMEITTDYGHANVWGLEKWVDFRLRSSEELPSRIQAAHDQHSLISINHPISDCPWTLGWVEGIDSIEVWQGLWNEGNYAAVAWWDELLTSGKVIVGVGGSDRHQPEHYDPYFPHQVGTPATRVKAHALSTASILSGLHSGRVVVAATPEGPWLEMTVTRGNTTATIGDVLDVDSGEDLLVRCSVAGAQGNTLEIVSGDEVIARRTCRSLEEEVVVRIDFAEHTYIRAQIIAGPENDSRAKVLYPLFLGLSNPVYLRRAGQETGTTDRAGE